MATESAVPITVQRAEPAVWISRLLILESVDPWTPIRNIPLHRGLNIVWSVDVDRNDDTAPVMTGHGVGKTTFCRLLRYCLGEASFGRNALVKRIRAQLPEAFVAAKLHVDGETWTVARPLGRSHISYAQRAVTIEQLFEDRPSPRSYHEFVESLSSVALRDFPPGITLTGNRPILWDHILAWCARDQEARYQNFWDWRSPRSDSDTPGFVRHREDPMFLTRAALGLVATTEINIQRRLLEIDERLKDLDRLIAERLREPEFQVRRLRRELIDDFDIPEASNASLDPTDLLSLQSFVSGRQTAIAVEIAAIDYQLNELNRKLLALQSNIQDAEQIAGQWSGSSNTVQGGSEIMLASIEQLKADRKRIDEVANSPCRFGNIPIGDCHYVQENMIRLDSLIADAGTSTSIQVSQRDQQSAEMRDAAERMSQRLRLLTAECDTLLKTKTDLETSRTNLSQKATSLPKRLKSVLGWQAIITDSSADETLAKHRTEQTELQTERTTKTDELSASLADQSQRLGNLQRVFGDLVAGVLNPEFRGTARIHDGEIECSITHGSVLAGEAVETLGVLLTDLACLLLGIEQNCQHPGFHIHDSPREADLGARIYRQFLGHAASLHQQLGGQNSAPLPIHRHHHNRPATTVAVQRVRRAPTLKRERHRTATPPFAR